MTHENSEIEEKALSEPLDFSQLVFIQIDRINKALTTGDEDFIFGVDSLECTLSPYTIEDKDYDKDLEDIRKAHEKALKDLKQRYGKLTRKQILSLVYTKTRLKFKALMRLISRNGLLPEVEVHWKERRKKLKS